MSNKIVIPTHCPCCGSSLERENDLLYCRNEACTSQASKSLEHFAKTMKIKGLGPAAIAKLGTPSIAELYRMSLSEITERLGSEKLAEKLFCEIRNSEEAPLNMVLPAFGIRLAGRSATEKLSQVCETIWDINAESCREAGLGPTVTNNLLEGLKHINLQELPFSFAFNRKKVIQEKKGIVCISGKLKSFKTKAEAARVLEEHGYEVKSSITKQVTILVNEGGVESAKTKQARESGVTIVTDLQAFLKGEND